MILVRPPTTFDLARALPHVRPQDIREWETASGLPFPQAATSTILSDTFGRCAVLVDGTPLCFWGGHEGAVWLFATTQGEDRWRALHRILQPHLQELVGRWPVVTALADSRNRLHHRWLERLGFEFVGEILSGPFDAPFKMYVKDDHQCAQ